MIDPSLTSVEIIGLAVAQEVVAYKRYQLFAARVTNPLAKEKFHSLAREEKAHREMLYKILQKYTGENRPPLPKNAPRLDSAQEGRLELREILDLAIKKEREAVAFYREAADRAGDPTGKHLLNYLATFEEGHERALKAEYDALTKYPRWFDMEGADIMLVGP